VNAGGLRCVNNWRVHPNEADMNLPAMHYAGRGEEWNKEVPLIAYPSRGAFRTMSKWPQYQGSQKM
jgi:hypothetical protein